MKLVVFDLRPGVVAGMVKVLRDAGHAVLGISWGGADRNQRVDGMYMIDDAVIVATKIRDFQPDFVFWNHFLRFPEGNARDIARLSGVPKAKSISNSRTPEMQDSYCGHVLRVNKMHLEDFMQLDYPELAAEATRQLLAELSEIAAKSTSA